MTQLPGVTMVAQTIQLAVAPVFLLAGIGAFLNVCVGRLARVIDRARLIEDRVMTSSGAEHDRLVWEINRLDRRMKVVNNAIFLSVASACAVSIVVMMLFLAELLSANMGTAVAIGFIIAMGLIIAAMVTFLVEVRLAARTIRVRDEVLRHEVDPAG
jgi:uncharacterized membrane protein (DUF485 family)